jgi:hypothetical protein
LFQAERDQQLIKPSAPNGLTTSVHVDPRMLVGNAVGELPGAQLYGLPGKARQGLLRAPVERQRAIVGMTDQQRLVGDGEDLPSRLLDASLREVHRDDAFLV